MGICALVLDQKELPSRVERQPVGGPRERCLEQRLPALGVLRTPPVIATHVRELQEPFGTLPFVQVLELVVESSSIPLALIVGTALVRYARFSSGDQGSGAE
jgi:hypothetical protein